MYINVDHFSGICTLLEYLLFLPLLYIFVLFYMAITGQLQQVQFRPIIKLNQYFYVSEEWAYFRHLCHLINQMVE